MRLYRLDYTTILHVLEGADTNGYNYAPKELAMTEWFTSERSAAARRLELFKMNKLVGKKREASIWGVDIPTRKVDLVGWLNAYEQEAA